MKSIKTNHESAAKDLSIVIESFRVHWNFTPIYFYLKFK